MRKNIILKSLSSKVVLSCCILSQSVTAMDFPGEQQDKISRNNKSVISHSSVQKNKKIKDPLNVKRSNSEIIIQNSSWVHFKPYLEKLVKSIISQSSIENMTIRFKLLGQNLEEYSAWNDSFLGYFRRYPISIGGGSDGAEGNKIDGRYESYNEFIQISNYTKKQKEAHEDFAYKAFGKPLGEILPKCQMTPTFYELMVNAGFKVEDFEKGKRGYQDRIYVKPIALKNKTLSKCAQEMREIILSTLEEGEQPYFAFIIDLPKNSPFNVETLMHFGGRDSFFHEIEPLSKLYHSGENRIYVCYANDKRKTLDLHDHSKKEAKEAVHNFLKGKYDNFETECNVHTGVGNHSTNGFGVIRNAFPDWVNEPELKSMVKSISLDYHRGDAGFNVKLFKPAEATLGKTSLENDVKTVIESLSKQDRIGNNRLKIIFQKNQPMPIGYADTVIAHATMKMCFPKIMNWEIKPNARHLQWYDNSSETETENSEESFENLENLNIAIPKAMPVPQPSQSFSEPIKDISQQKQNIIPQPLQVNIPLKKNTHSPKKKLVWEVKNTENK